MDNIKQIGKILDQSRKNVDTSLRRNFPNQPLIERARDFFDDANDFEMEFIVPNLPAIGSMSLIFMPMAGPCNDMQSGCFIGRCDYYYGSTDMTLTTTYNFIAGTVFVYKNDTTVTFTETGTNEITLSSSRLSTDKIRVCYIYQVSGCTGCTNEVFIIDNFNRTQIESADWGTSSSGNTWASDVSDVTYSIDGDYGHLISLAGGIGGDTIVEFDNSVVQNQRYIEMFWLCKDFAGGGNDFTGMTNDTFTFTYWWRLLSTDGPSHNPGDFNVGRHNTGTTTTIITGNPLYLSENSFWVGLKLDYLGNMHFKHWLTSETEPEWADVTSILGASLLDVNLVTKTYTTGGASSVDQDFGISQINLRVCVII